MCGLTCDRLGHAAFLKIIVLFLALLGLHCGVWASHCGGFSLQSRALGTQALVVAVPGLYLECWFSSFSTWA